MRRQENLFSLPPPTFSIDFRYVILGILGIDAFQFSEAVKRLSVPGGTNIVGYIQVPPRAIEVDAVPSVPGCTVLIRCAVHHVTRDILTAAERRKQMRKIKADALTGA